MTDRAPKGLGAAGSELWTAIIDDLSDDWTLDARERQFLERACRCADELLALQDAVDSDGVIALGSRGQAVAHPALSEARQLRLVLLRLLSALEMTDPLAAQRAATPAQARARKAAEARWAQRAARDAS